MKKNLTLVFFIFTILFSNCKKSNPDNSNESGLQRISEKDFINGGGYGTYANDFVELNDGSIIILASISDQKNSSDNKLSLIKVDKNGNHLWSKTLLSGDYDFDRSYYPYVLHSIQKDKSENLIICASSKNNNEFTYLFKTNRDGDIIWLRGIGGYGISNEGRNNGNCIILPNDDIVLAFNPLTAYEDYCILSFVSADNSKYYTQRIPDLMYIGEIIYTSDNNLLLFGTKRFNGGRFKASLIKTTTFGNILWRKDLNETEAEKELSRQPYCGIELDNKYYFTGFGTNASHLDYLFHSYSNSGERLVTKQFNLRYYDIGLTMAAISSSHIAVGGSSSETAFSETDKPFLTIFDKDGNKIVQDSIAGYGTTNAIKKSSNNTFNVLLSVKTGDNTPKIKLIKYSYK